MTEKRTAVPANLREKRNNYDAVLGNRWWCDLQPKPFDPQPVIRDRSVVEEKLEQLYWDAQAIEHELVLTIGLARDGGFSWQDVADALGLESKQAAQKRYGAMVREAMDNINDHDEGKAELEKMARKLTVRPGLPTYEVVKGARFVGQRMEAGKVVSAHRSRLAAEKALDRAGDGHQLVQVSPNGRRRRPAPPRVEQAQETKRAASGGGSSDVFVTTDWEDF